MSLLSVGINYEGGKVTEFAEMSHFCLGYVNAQIAMDAPFHQQIADESVRKLGRSETSMKDYDETKMLSEIDACIKIVKNFLAMQVSSTGIEPLTIIQVARGRSAADTIALITPLLVDNAVFRYQISTGYKSTHYFQPPNEPFVLLNIGMFGRLSDVDSITPGSILNPVYTFDIYRSDTSHKSTTGTDSVSFALSTTVPRRHTNSKNLLHNSSFPSLILLGIADNMPFVTPSEYNREEMYRIVDTVVSCVTEKV